MALASQTLAVAVSLRRATSRLLLLLLLPPRRPRCRLPPPLAITITTTTIIIIIIIMMLPLLLLFPFLVPTTSLLFPLPLASSLPPSAPEPTKSPLLPFDFPDPCVFYDPPSGKWYAFATGSFPPPAAAGSSRDDDSDRNRDSSSGSGSEGEGRFKNIQAAEAPSPSGPWTYLRDADPLPSPGPWTAGPGSQTWAPSVVRIPSFSFSSSSSSSSSSSLYVLYYAAQLPGNRSAFHCVGAATARSALGPYAPLARPLVCPLAEGGAIDPAVFWDGAVDSEPDPDPDPDLPGGNGDWNWDGDGDGEGRKRMGRKRRLYLLYKVDGNAVGGGGACNNGVEPRRRTPIMLQEVDAADGVTLLGRPVEVLDRAEEDGPLVEAPDLLFVRQDGGGGGGDREAEGDGDGDGDADGNGDGHGKGWYVLFYSNHCWDGPAYSVNYAVARTITGPYARSADGPLIWTGHPFNVTAPGGAASVPGGRALLFHGDCPAGRCLFGAEMRVDGAKVVVS